MKTIKIPAWKNPYPVTINGKEQRFPSGKKIEVEDNIAEIIQRDIDAHASAATPTPTPEKNTPLRIKTWLGEGGKMECDTSNEAIIKAINAGKIIVCDKTDADGVQQVVGYTDETTDGDMNKVTVGGYSFNYLKNGYDITKDVSCGLGLALWRPYTTTNASRQCFNNKYLSFDAGSVIAVGITSTVEYKVCFWFISKEVAKMVMANETFQDFVLTDWQSTNMTSVVPDDTAYVWINLKRADDSVCDPSDITRITVRKVS